MTQADGPRGHGKAKREIALQPAGLGLRCGHLFAWQRWMRGSGICFCSGRSCPEGMSVQPLHVYGDVETLVNEPYCYKLQGYHSAPEVDVMLAGFPCKSVSCLNSSRMKLTWARDAAHDVRAVGVSGNVFYKIRAFVEARRPRFVILENVAGISHKKKGGDRSPAEHMQHELEQLGYYVEYKQIKTDEFLPQTRSRVWFVCVLKREAAKVATVWHAVQECRRFRAPSLLSVLRGAQTFSACCQPGQLQAQEVARANAGLCQEAWADQGLLASCLR